MQLASGTMQRAMLLGLLGAAALAELFERTSTTICAVISAPVDNRDHNEEMVTRCIIEVLSNALSKSSAPTITPECRQVLRKSGKEVKGEEKGENENSKFEVRLLRDPSDASVGRWASSREETGAPVEDSPGQAKVDNEEWTGGGGHSREAVDDQESLHPSNQQVSKEAKIRHSEERGGKEEEEEEGKIYPKGEHRGDAGEEKKHTEESGEKHNAFSNKRSEASAKKKEESVARAEAHFVELEKTHSREQSSQESGEETRRQEKPQELPDQDQSEEESEEGEEGEEGATSEVTKRRPRHHHWRSQSNKPSYEGRRPLSEERKHAAGESKDANVATANLGEKRGHHLAHYRASEEEPDYGEELRSYPGFQAPQGLQYRGRGSEEVRAPSPRSEESQEKEYKRNHPDSELESTANRHSEETEEERSYEGAKGRQHRGRGREPGAYPALDSRQEKRLLDEGHDPVHESPVDTAKRYPQSKWQEQEKNYLNYDEEGDQGRWWQQEEQLEPEESREEVSFPDRQYAPYPTTEKRKRLGALFNPYFDPLQWKNSDFEKKGNPDDSFLDDDGEDGNGVTMTEKNFFPEYNYDWWEKRPFSEDVNWGYEKRSFAKAPHLDLKRQYDDGVAELDQLLHYRKKAAEFPDFYDSEEQMGPHQEAEDEKDRADQRVLTEEEKKELENLAAMDLELQKIAEKFSQRG